MILSIGELATRSGVTVRALRHYESKGLLKPARSQAGQRAYKYPDIVRLQQIQLLKKAGFTLTQIKTMIGSAKIEAKNILRIQRSILAEQLKQTEAALTAIDNVINHLEDTATDLFTLCNMIKLGESAMSEEKWQKVWDKFYTDEEQEAWRQAKEAIPESVRRECERKWPEVIGRAEALVGTDPAAPQAQQVLTDWNNLVQIFANNAPELAASANRMYDNMGDWPEDAPQSPISPDVWAFIKAAQKAKPA